MVQEIRTQPSVFGRIGQGLGQGLAESIPKEVEHRRLRTGLQNLADESDKGNLSSAQFLARAAGTYGSTPQIIQSFGELAKQQRMLQGLQQGNVKDQKQPSFSDIKSESQTPGQSNQIPRSITSVEGIEATRKPYIPMNTQQKNQLKLQLHAENPGLYPDLQSATAAVENIDAENKSINAAQQAQRAGEQDIQSTLKNELVERAKTLGHTPENPIIPGNVLSDLQDQAIDELTKGKSTEKELAAKYGKKLDGIAREYNALDTLGNFTLPFRNPIETRRAIQSARNGFKARNDLENFADTLIGENGLSPGKSYFLSYPISEQKPVKNIVESLPKLERIRFKNGYAEPLTNSAQTLEVSKKIAPLLKGTDASPLSIAEELNAKGYDPDTWLDYVTKNQRKLDLSERQGRELGKPRNWFPSLNDLFLFIGAGMDNMVEE